MEELVDDTTTVLGKKDKVFLNGDWVGVCSDSTSGSLLISHFDDRVFYLCHILYILKHLLYI
jgi:hypothetical protein